VTKLFDLTLDQNYSYDVAMLITNDSDMKPAIATVKRLFPAKTIDVIYPIDSKQSIELKSVCDNVHKIKEYHLWTSLLPDPIIAPSTGKTIICPQAGNNEYILKF